MFSGRYSKLDRQLAAQALTQLHEDRLDLALLLAVEAYRAADTFEARSSLFTVLEYNPRVLTFLRGNHGGETVAFSPDGRTLAATRYKGIALWDVDTARLLSPPLVGHTERVFSIAFSPDGKILASTGTTEEDQNVILWDVATRQPLGKIVHDYAQSVAFSPDAKILATGGGDHSVMLWDVATRQPLGPPLNLSSTSRTCRAWRSIRTAKHWYREVGTAPLSSGIPIPARRSAHPLIQAVAAKWRVLLLVQTARH
jgi:hypothetical protein